MVPEAARVAVAGPGPRASDYPALVRRADWRFLLPIGIPTRTAFVGDRESTGWRSLTTVCGSAVLVRPDALVEPPERANFELVVVQEVSPDTLWTATALLAPGGFLYGEIDLRGLGAGGIIRGLRWDPAAELTGLGMTDVQVHWHYPNFERRRCIVPADELPTGVRHLRRGKWKPLLTALALSLSLPLVPRILPRLLPCVSFVARRAPAVEASS